MERDLADRDRGLEALKADRNWILQVRLVHVMDKLIEHPKFAAGIDRIRHAAFFVGEESGRAGLKE